MFERVRSLPTLTSSPSPQKIFFFAKNQPISLTHDIFDDNQPCRSATTLSVDYITIILVIESEFSFQQNSTVKFT